MTTAAPSWDELSASLRAASTPEENRMREDQALGYGPPQYFAPKRLFDAPADYQPRITFYHDQNVWCPFCTTMWLYLEEKRIPYTSIRVNKEPYGYRGPDDEHYYGMLGATGVPGVQIDNGRLVQGADFFNIERRFPGVNPLIPADDDPAVTRWQQMHDNMEAFTNGFWSLNKATLQGPVKESAQYQAFIDAADRLNESLGAHGGPYLVGNKLTILDVQFTRNAERAAAMLPYFKGVQVRRNPRWPHLERWYEVMSSRSSYKAIAGDFYTHASATPLQVPFLVGAKHSDGEAFARIIDGSDGVSWTLPLPEDDGSLLEPVAPFEQSAAAARREAVERLLHNHRAVVGFAARGVLDKHTQRPGSRDPEYAAKYGAGIPPTQSGVEFGKTSLGRKYGGSDALVRTPEILADVALRLTVKVLIEGASDAAKAAIASETLPIDETRRCLSYLRDRISVPRDMGYPAARQLRAYLNYVIAAVEEHAAIPAYKV